MIKFSPSLMAATTIFIAQTTLTGIIQWSKTCKKHSNYTEIQLLEPLVTNIMWRNLCVQAIYQFGVLLVLNFNGTSLLKLENETPADAKTINDTVVFNAFVLCQIFNEFNARKPEEMNVFKGVTKNSLFIGIIVGTFVLQYPALE